MKRPPGLGASHWQALLGKAMDLQAMRLLKDGR
jgi:hypothetical protein